MTSNALPRPVSRSPSNSAAISDERTLSRSISDLSQASTLVDSESDGEHHARSSLPARNVSPARDETVGGVHVDRLRSPHSFDMKIRIREVAPMEYMERIVAGLRRQAADLLTFKEQMCEPAGIWIDAIKEEVARAGELADSDQQVRAYELFNKVIRELEDIGFMGREIVVTKL